VNGALRAIILHMLNKRYIGNKHLPEDLIVKRKIKWLSNKDVSEFESEYKKMINEGFIIKLKKRSGKGSDWHLSLNPRKLDELKTLI
jgi:hypothetical protein